MKAKKEGVLSTDAKLMISMTSFVVIIPVFMFVLSLISLLLTIKYQNDSRRISSLCSQRDSIQVYAEKVVTACRVYLESQILYVKARQKLEIDMLNGHDITIQRSNYVYELKDAVLQNRIKLHVTMELLNIEITDSEFPNVKLRLAELFYDFQRYAEHWDTDVIQFTDDEVQQYVDDINQRISQIVYLFGQTQDQLTISIHNTNLYSNIMKHFRHVTIDPLFEPIKHAIKQNKEGK